MRDVGGSPWCRKLLNNEASFDDAIIFQSAKVRGKAEWGVREGGKKMGG
jgi:hypothetical protein